jgi:hypothetical protein
MYIHTKEKRANMQDTYVVTKFKEGEVHFQNGAAGWLFDSGEFRPLMDDAMEQLQEAGLVDQATVDITASARDVYTEKSIAEYIEAQKNRTAEQIAEERFEARAAHGEGVRLVNIITGETYTT